MLGLDSASSALLFQAEQLHNLGELEIALKCFQAVLDRNPDCSEAAARVRTIREDLGAKASGWMVKSRLLPVVLEEEHDKTSKQHDDHTKHNWLRQSTFRVKVAWRGSEDFRTNYVPHPDDCAREAARQELMWSGWNKQNVDLKLLSNTTLGSRRNEATGWELLIWGEACLQVTLFTEPPIQLPNWKDLHKFEELYVRQQERRQQQPEHGALDEPSLGPGRQQSKET